VLAVDGRDYEIRRQVESDGEQSARLARLGATEPLARGPDAVVERLSSLLGFGFEEYRETFYLAQRELTAPDPQSPALRQMAGVGPLLACAEELRAEVATERGAAQRFQDRIAAIDAELAELASTHPQAEGAEDDLAATRRRERAVAGLLKGLPEAAQAYTAGASPSFGATLHRGLVSLASVLLLLAALLVGGLWAMLRLRPEQWPMPAVRRWLEAVFAPLGLTAEAALVFVGIALAGAVLLVGLWYLARVLVARTRRGRGRRLAALFEQIDDLDAGPIATLPPPQRRGAARARRRRLGGPPWLIGRIPSDACASRSG
jgi:exonuclease SbcC